MKLCLFSSYSTNNKIDNYVEYYLEQLKKRYDYVIFITNEREICNYSKEFLIKIDCELLTVINEGFDFGMWYKALNYINDINKYDEIAFVNDSCILFKPLDYIFEEIEKSECDFISITDSYQISYHLQSYFTVAKGKNIINEINNYYNTNGIIKSPDVRDIINVYEIGLSTNLINMGFKIESIFKYKKYNDSENLSLLNAKDMINDNSPIIKRKLLFKNFREYEIGFLSQVNFDFNFDYVQLIRNKIESYNISLEYLFDI